MTSTYMHHQTWKKNLPPNYTFDDRASLSTGEAEQLSEFYKSRYLYYVQQKMTCTLDYDDMAVKNIDVYDVDFGMRDCKKVYDKLRVKLMEMKGSNRTLDIAAQSKGSELVDDSQKNNKSNEVPNQLNSDRTSKENTSLSSASDSLYSSNFQETDKEINTQAEKLINEEVMQKERNELIQLVKNISSNIINNCDKYVEKSEKKLSDGELLETPVTGNPDRETNKFKSLNIEFEKEAKESLKTKTQDQFSHFTWIKSSSQNGTKIQDFVSNADLDLSDDLWLSQLPKVYQYILMMLEASDKQMKQITLINSLLFADSELKPAHLIMLAYTRENPLIKVCCERQGETLLAEKHFKNVDLSLARKWSVSETGESAVEMADRKLVSLQVEVQALLLKCKQLKVKFEEVSRSSIGNTLVQVRERFFYFFAKKSMSALEDDDYLDSEDCVRVNKVLGTCHDRYQRVNAMFVSFGEVFAKTEHKPDDNHDNRFRPEIIRQHAPMYKKVPMPSSNMLRARRGQMLPVLDQFDSYDEESFEEECYVDEGFVYAG